MTSLCLQMMKYVVNIKTSFKCNFSLERLLYFELVVNFKYSIIVLFSDGVIIAVCLSSKFIFGRCRISLRPHICQFYFGEYIDHWSSRIFETIVIALFLSILFWLFFTFGNNLIVKSSMMVILLLPHSLNLNDPTDIRYRFV